VPFLFPNTIQLYIPEYPINPKTIIKNTPRDVVNSPENIFVNMRRQVITLSANIENNIKCKLSMEIIY